MIEKFDREEAVNWIRKYLLGSKMKKSFLVNVKKTCIRQFQRNFSLDRDWNTSHVLFKHKEVSDNVFFIQEKYFEFSWNLANIFFIKVRD